MFATGMMDPNWWKDATVCRTWYKDDETYAIARQYQESFPLTGRYIAIRMGGLYAFTAFMFPAGTSFEQNEGPFDVPFTGPVNFSRPDGTAIYQLNKIVYENKTLSFSITKIETGEEIPLVMNIAPEGFDAGDLERLIEEHRKGPSAPENAEDQMPGPAAPWTCQCGAENTGKFCTQCGHPYS